MEPDQYRRKKRGPQRPREGRPGKLVRQPTETPGMQARRRERQMRKRRQEGSRLRASDVESGMGGYMTGGQAKIAAKAPPPNKIDEKDFAVLRAEKAKGRRQGLQDEKMKPGKVMKANTGRAISGPTQGPRGLGGTPNRMTPEGIKKAKEKILMDIFKKKRKEQSDKPKIPLGGKMKKPKPGSSDYQILQTGKPRPSQILPKKKMGGVMKANKGKSIKNNPVKTVNPFAKIPMEKAKELAVKRVKATRIGKIALGVAGVGLAAKEFIKRKMEKRKRIKREKDAVRTLKGDIAIQELKESLPKKMGGGMMQRPMMGYKSGKMIKAKGCKLGRSKPTKLY